MAMVRTPGTPGRVVLFDIDWRTYRTIGRALADRPALRLTYDRGVLEIARTTTARQRIKRILGRLVDAWTEERGVAVAGYGSITLSRRKPRRALEPDECYWIAHEAQMRGRDRMDFRIDPPPDLVLEIGIPRSALSRMGIYGVLGVPEVWRYSKGKLSFRARQSDGRYADAPTSLALPPLTPADLTPFLAMRGRTEENALVRQFRAWIHHKYPAGGATPPGP